MADLLQLVERNSGRLFASEIVDREIVKDLEEPTDEATLLVVGRKPFECACEGFLSEIFRRSTIPDHAGRKVHGWRRIARYQIPICGLRSGKRLLHQFNIAGSHGHYAIRVGAGGGFEGRAPP